MTDRFPNAPVTVTLTGEEWFAIAAVLTYGRKALAPHSVATFHSACTKLANQVSGADRAIASGRRPHLHLVDGSSQ